MHSKSRKILPSKMKSKNAGGKPSFDYIYNLIEIIVIVIEIKR